MTTGPRAHHTAGEEGGRIPMQMPTRSLESFMLYFISLKSKEDLFNEKIHFKGAIADTCGDTSGECKTTPKKTKREH